MKLHRVVSGLAVVTGLLGSAPLLAQSVAQEAALAGQTSEAPRQAVAPNVLVWMLDDVGFAQLSSFGGLVPTPNIDRVAKLGLRYTNYHTAPICSASRAAMLTGRNPHSVNIGGHAGAERSVRGYNSRVPASAGTIAANLRQAGYATFAIGKWDHLPSADASPAGPFTYWPAGQGFDRFLWFSRGRCGQLVANPCPRCHPGRPSRGEGVPFEQRPC